MRDVADKMAELKFEAPLAQFEETDEWPPMDKHLMMRLNKDDDNNDPNFNNVKQRTTTTTGNSRDDGVVDDDDNRHRSTSKDHRHNDDEDSMLMMMNTTTTVSSLKKQTIANHNGGSQCDSNCNATAPMMSQASLMAADNFNETFSGSLEDLVNTFDDKITKCFGNYEESVEKLAPVQVRTQEEIMNECQMWWTITGNFGNILPIDWTKSFSRKMHMPTLNLGERKGGQTPEDDLLSSEDEAVASDLDMHALILGGLHQDHECPVKTADEVIQEIDDMMQESSPGSEDDIIEHNEALEKGKEVLSSPLYEDKLKTLTLSQLNELYLELEVLIREFSETLISELALRDELEYEKELKNTFISLLLAVQNKRRQYHVEKKRISKNGNMNPMKMVPNSGNEPKYLTTVIPYHLDSGPPDNQALQVLIKILKAINEDSPTVPTLLTDYILKVLCPT